MSIQLIQLYYNHVDQLIRYGGTRNEMSLRKAFQELLEHYARSKNLLLVPVRSRVNDSKPGIQYF